MSNDRANALGSAIQSHTRGPWAVAEGAATSQHDPRRMTRIVMADYPETTVARCHMGMCSGEQQEANARLIAAAPDLLASLRALHSACVDQGIKFGPLIADAEAAIAKATGGQQ